MCGALAGEGEEFIPHNEPGLNEELHPQGPPARWFAESQSLTDFLQLLLPLTEPREDGDQEQVGDINLNRRRWDVPLYPEATIRVSGAIQQLLAWKKDTNASDRQLQSLMKLLSGWVPAAVRFPRTLYEVRTTMETPDLWRVRHHVCLTGNHFWEPIPPGQYEEHALETCACGFRRFHEQWHGDQRILTPVRVSATRNLFTTAVNIAITINADG